MAADVQAPVKILMVAVPETAGSTLYGMVDVFCSTGVVWQTLMRMERLKPAFQVLIVGQSLEPFSCGNRIPVQPDVGVGDDPSGEVIVIPELWLGPDEDLSGQYPELIDWIRRKYRAGATLYSACSGSLFLAETGLLDGRDATSHWAYENLFHRLYPSVRFRPEANLAFADPAGRIVTAGGATSWHDLALHVIARYAGQAEALRVAKLYLLKWHSEGQLPFADLIRRSPHGDSIVRRCEQLMDELYQDKGAIHRITHLSGIPERTLKRRFKAATGQSLIDYLQNVRVERAKRHLEGDALSVDAISAEVGYEDASFFRRLFRRRTGLTPKQYRRMFQRIPGS